MKILILGSGGQLGSSFKKQFNVHRQEVRFASREEIDITDFESVQKCFLGFRPDVVINGAAYTSVEAAENHFALANSINNVAVSNLAINCNLFGAILIHVSTDYIFDGEAALPYRENDAANPKNAYGKTKLLGEKGILKSGCKYLIFRTSWLFSQYGKNFVKTMLLLGKEKAEVRIVNDEYGCPTCAVDLAKSIATIVNMFDRGNFRSGIYHYTGNEACSWYIFAREIFSYASRRGLCTPKKLVAVSRKDYPTKALRPKYSVLSNEKFINCFEIKPSDWREGLEETIKQLAKQKYQHR